MPSNQTYEVIWNPDAVLDLAQYVKYAKTTIDDVYDKTNVLLGKKPYTIGHKVIFKGYEYDGYKWMNVKNVILLYEKFKKEKTVAIDACYYSNKKSAEIFYGIDPNKGLD
ncbi:hypothetical protein [Oceanobacillus caeni]|uniref:hypothetical protein n=1 Tax=Oceanobacillus caeni TaxID=405946 RepID=UPI0036289A3A